MQGEVKGLVKFIWLSDSMLYSLYELEAGTQKRGFISFPEGGPGFKGITC